MNKETQDVVYEIVSDMLFSEKGKELATDSNRQIHLRIFALDLLNKYRLKSGKIDALVNTFLDEERERIFPGKTNLRIAVDVAILGGSAETAEKVMARAAQHGLLEDVERLADYLDRDPTEEEAFAVVMAEAKSAIRRGGKAPGHRFMTAWELDLMDWAGQYIKSPGKFVELEEAFKEKGRTFDDIL